MPVKTRSRRQTRPERGQSLAEFALMLTLMLTLLMGIIDLGRAYFTYLALNDAAAEGAYYGSVYPNCPASDTCANPNNILYRVRTSAPAGGLVDWSDTSRTSILVNGVGNDPGGLITVTVTYQYELITPVIGAIVGSQQLPLRASSTAVIVEDKIP